MKDLMTKHFSKWVAKQKISKDALVNTLKEFKSGNYDANLGGHIYKKRIGFRGKGKSGSGRTIICYQKGNVAVFLYGFAKNEKSNLTKKELIVFKEMSKVILGFSQEKVKVAIEKGDFIEVKS